MGILNQLSIVFGLLLGQSLAFPFAKAYIWRYTMIVAVGIAVLQLFAGFAVPVPRKEVGGVDEERPLLVSAEEPVLSLKGVLRSQDKIVRRGCE